MLQSHGRNCRHNPKLAGVSFERLDKVRSLHWPVKGKDHPGTPILHLNEFTAQSSFMLWNHI